MDMTTDIVQEETKVVTDSEKIQKALELIHNYGTTDGAHHKTWVLDHVVRELCGDIVTYGEWVRNFEAGEDGPHTYEWDTGTPP